MHIGPRSGTTWEPNPEHRTPKAGEPEIHRAARLGDAAALRRLAAMGEDLNVIFDVGLDPSSGPWPATPLMVAAGSGEGATAETVRALLELGADPTRETRAGSAAMFACIGLGWNYPPGGDAARLRLLLTAGSPLPLTGEKAAWLVSQVAARGDPERLSALLSLGAPATPVFDPARARERHRQLQASMRQYRESMPNPFAGLPESVRDRMKQIEADRERADEERAASAPSSAAIPFFQAVGSGSGECVQLLLDAGADVHQRDDGRRTALWEAWTESTATLLVQNGLNIEDQDWLGWTPLMAGLDDLEKTRALIAAGADVNATHDRGYTVFMSAVGASERNPAVLRCLIAAGADPHAVSELGYTAFHAAIDVNGEANHEDSVRATLTYLKSLGVDLEHRNNRGQTPLARALAEGTATEVTVLCEIGADVNASGTVRRCGAAVGAAWDAPLLFLAAGAAVDPDQKAAAMLVAGADPLALDGDGRTALDALLADLCAQCVDATSALRNYHEGLRDLRLPELSPGDDRERFISGMRPALHEHNRGFVKQVLAGSHDRTTPSLEETVRLLTTLASHEYWARGARPA